MKREPQHYGIRLTFSHDRLEAAVGAFSGVAEVVSVALEDIDGYLIRADAVMSGRVSGSFRQAKAVTGTLSEALAHAGAQVARVRIGTTFENPLVAARLRWGAPRSRRGYFEAHITAGLDLRQSVLASCLARANYLLKSRVGSAPFRRESMLFPTSFTMRYRACDPATFRWAAEGKVRLMAVGLGLAYADVGCDLEYVLYDSAPHLDLRWDPDVLTR